MDEKRVMTEHLLFFHEKEVFIFVFSHIPYVMKELPKLVQKQTRADEMLLAKETILSVSDTDSNYIGHMCYTASKLWNLCNYEKKNYKHLGMEYPSWYDQKKRLKDHLWYKSLPSQTAQEVCKDLEEAWRSFFSLLKHKSIKNPRPPRYQQKNMPVKYLQNGMRHDPGSDTIRLTLSKGLKAYMQNTYGIHQDYLFLKSRTFQEMDAIKQLMLYPAENGRMRIIIIYEIPDVPLLPENGKYLSIDMGLHNLMTCYDSRGCSFIIGKMYLSVCRTFDKAIGHVQSQWGTCQSRKGVAYPKGSQHQKRLYVRKNHSVKDYLHKITRWIAQYCKQNDIHTVVLGDITNIRENKNMGHQTNQVFHALPYRKIRLMLQYKLAMYGIRLVLQEESYTSQCPPTAPEVTKRYALPNARKHRGLYVLNGAIYNADAVGAYNILKKYLQKVKRQMTLPLKGLSSPKVIQVAV